jgi:hypothetical protein
MQLLDNSYINLNAHGKTLGAAVPFLSGPRKSFDSSNRRSSASAHISNEFLSYNSCENISSSFLNTSIGMWFVFLLLFALTA